MRIVYLTPRSSFRDNLQSDSLWGLICWGVKTLYSDKDLEEMIAGYATGYPLKVSSAFRWIKTESGIVRFFPKPGLPPFDLQEMVQGREKKGKVEVFARLKKWRAQKEVSEEVFFRMLTGDLSESEFFMKDELWKRDSLKKHFSSETSVHNSINRLTASTNRPENDRGTKPGGLFSREEIFAKDGGLFLLLDGEQKYLEMAEAALRYYSHMGFMGDSSTGKNHFDLIIEDYNLPVVKDPNGFVNLSLYIPTAEEAGLFKAKPEKCYYELVTRKGKVSSAHLNTNDFWKSSVLAFKEGSVFPAHGKAGYGVIRKVKRVAQPFEFDVYQSGIAFNLPMRLS